MLACTSTIAYADIRAQENKIFYSGVKHIVPSQNIPNFENKELPSTPSAPMKFAQNNDGIRVLQLEDQVRHLNGQIEEMQFQLLQMQEQMRKMQEDNEFRFQELEQSSLQKDENKKVASNIDKDNRLGKSQPSESSIIEGTDGKSLDVLDLTGRNNTIKNGNLKRTIAKKTINGVEIFDPNKDKSADELGADANIKFGAFKFDGSGNVIPQSSQNSVGAPIRLGEPLKLGVGSSASSTLPNSPDELFNLGYQYVQAGQYNQSVEVFDKFVALHPTHKKLAAAQFWLGESYFSIGQYEDAAKVFLLNHKEHPKAKLGAQNLLKLGVSLAGLNQRELACATYADVYKKYPKISSSVRKRIGVEQRAAKCKN